MNDVMGTISYEEFTGSCLEFLKLSQELQDGWEAKGDALQEGNFYLMKLERVEDVLQDSLPPREKCSGDKDGNTKDNIETIDIMEDNDDLWPEDPSVIHNVCLKTIITYEYHITYSISYSVPVLFFNAYNHSGKLLTLEDMWRRVSPQHSKQILHQKWESLTQQEHPVLGRPFYQLHPCNTAKLMAEFSKNRKDLDTLKGLRYMISWLSTFGQVVGLKLPISYFQ
ncbi:ubiquitin-like-conjugating enzyme ATG10 isoform X1 [Penaeus chinensis]|uniref:ubiquitin-like-conjugating enzyme ATG10 isoform X1 n=2 Tax=Penaeus chinensis TaxID=139456 RepID=UPI001FB6A414|nr:ubiquitin-like-conjugating enzyme ATG10 isoform X1 [Penaeus chinensis]